MNLQTTPKSANGLYVALVEDGVPKFSEKPVRHLTKNAALAEAQRLSRKYPGQLFQVFGAAHVMKESTGLGSFRVPNVPAPLTAFTPKLEGVSGDELFTTASPGVYREIGVGLHNTTLFFVVNTGGNRVVLMQSGPRGTAQVASRSAWSVARFKLTGPAREVRINLSAA